MAATDEAATDENRGPLVGIRVLDLADERAEYAGRLLADLGAEVIKVEPPGGTPSRRVPPFADDAADDPEGSLYWALTGFGKRSVVLDYVREDGDRRQLRELIASSDVLVESFDPGTLDTIELGYESVRTLNPSLIYVSVTPFGQDGPAALTPATELTIEAAGGLVGLQGDGDRPPLPVGYPQAAFHAGVQAAADVIMALNERRSSGLGQHLDVSMQAAIIWTLLNAMGYPAVTGEDPPGTGDRRTTPALRGPPGIPMATECADGYLTGGFGLGKSAEQGLHLVARWMEEEDFLDQSLRGRDWTGHAAKLREGAISADDVRSIFEQVQAFFKTKTKQEIMARASRDHFMVAPMFTVADLHEDPQLIARAFWQELEGRVYPGPFVHFSRTPISLQTAAPRLGQDQSLLDDRTAAPRPVETRPVDTRPVDTRPVATSNVNRRKALDGIKVADFSWAGVGPMVAKALADHGATVVKIESERHPDFCRLLAPFKDNIPGINRSQFGANFNTSKLSAAIDFQDARGRALTKRIIDWADVVVENFAPGAMKRLGFDFSTLSRERPDLIMLSTSLRGQTGPQASFAGVGTQGQALSGLHYITGWPDRRPCGPWGAYSDVIAARYGAAAVAAAIYERRESGLGQLVDLSQVEAAIYFLGPLLLDYGVNGRVAAAHGYDSDRACPHGVYATDGVERYIAIAVETAEQWQALKSIAPLDQFDEASFDALAARIASRDAMNAALREWCAGKDGQALAVRLTGAGVPASVVLRPSELLRDPQLAHRQFFVTLEHGEMGSIPYDGFVTRFSETPPELRSAAPLLGEHTHHVLRDLLGCSDEEIAEYAAANVLA